MKEVAVLEDRRRLGMNFSHRRCEFWRREGDPLEKRPVELAFQFPLAPLLAGGEPQVELAFVVPFAPAHDEQVVRPGQFSHQWCEFWLVAVGLEKLHHPPEIAGRVAANIGLLPADVLGEGFDRPFSPAVIGDFPLDEFADAPVKLDQSRVDGGDGPRPRGVDQFHDNIEILRGGFRCGRRRHEAAVRHLLGSFPGCFLAFRHAGSFARASNADRS